MKISDYFFFQGCTIDNKDVFENVENLSGHRPCQCFQRQIYCQKKGDGTGKTALSSYRSESKQSVGRIPINNEGIEVI